MLPIPPISHARPMVNWKTANKNPALWLLCAVLAIFLIDVSASPLNTEDSLASLGPAEKQPRGTLFSTIFVTPGQRLPNIARMYQMSLQELLEANRGLLTTNYKPGDALRVSQPLNQIPSLPDLSLELRRGIRGRKQIALTFDCGWVPPKDLQLLLQSLQKNRIQASFFLTGIFLKGNPKAVSAIRGAGFPVYNHSYSHKHFKSLTNEQIQMELLRLEEMVNQQAPETTRPYWRPPYGERDKRILKAAAEVGFRSIYWTFDSHDTWTSPTLTPEGLFDRVCNEIYQKNPDDPDPLDGAIILFHAGSAQTPQALNLIAPHLRGKGYSFVDIQTLISP